MTEFQKQVIQRVKMIPYGKVVSYGQIAESISAPRAARQVGWVMRSLEMKVDMPWWRVMNNQGKLTIKGNIINNANFQRKLLLAEGVAVSENYTIEIEKYRFHFINSSALEIV